ncbi:CU044_5270 family protein [Arthrobacter sp. KNU-44]|uniref:CU044_5270 family protein n=1 Tax=Arthrobacter sp. KNU-44 TaxID=3450744 RepID=UPI003F437E51
METLEDLIGRANPALADAHRALDERAEHDLAAILGRTATLGTRVPRSFRRRTLLLAAGTAAAAAGVVLATRPAGPGTPNVQSTPIPEPVLAPAPAMLDPKPIAKDAGTVLEEARQKLRTPDGPGYSPGYFTIHHWEAGIMQNPDNSPAMDVSLPVTVETRRETDGSGTRTLTVGQPFSPTRSDVKFRALGWPMDVQPGQTKRESYGPGQIPAPALPQPVPTDDAGMAAYIGAFQARSSAMVNEGPQGVFQTIGFFVGYWDLSNAQERAVLGAVAKLPGLRVLGEVTDRLGRHGIALSVETRDERYGTSSNILVIDPATGRILATEEDYVQGPADGRKPDRPVPTVMRYIAIENPATK